MTSLKVQPVPTDLHALNSALLQHAPDEGRTLPTQARGVRQRDEWLGEVLEGRDNLLRGELPSCC